VASGVFSLCAEGPAISGRRAVAAELTEEVGGTHTIGNGPLRHLGAAGRERMGKGGTCCCAVAPV